MLFQSTHSLRSATGAVDVHSPDFYVSIHALLAECDLHLGKYRQQEMVSIHALLAECDPAPRKISSAGNGFNPRTPCGVRLIMTLPILTRSLFQSTHSLRSATSKYTGACHEYAVSIHALLAECDLNGARDWCEYSVSIHALLAECDERD